MDISMASSTIVSGDSLAYIKTNGEYIMKSVAQRPIDLPDLIQYNKFNFDRFYNDDTEYTAILYTDPRFTILKIAIPTDVTRISVFSNGIIKLNMYPNNREKSFNSISTIYQQLDTSTVLLKTEECIIHESNECNPHESQIAYDIRDISIGSILSYSLVNNSLTGYNGAISGTTLLTDDGCKYWLGNFDGSQY